MKTTLGVLIWGLLIAATSPAEALWTLKTGPVPVTSIPLDPPQLVSAWRGQYGDGEEVIWLYVTRSPHFFPPRVPEVDLVTGTPWTVVVFYPTPWVAADRRLWLDQWEGAFRELYSLPEPGYPVLFPAVLRKG